MKYFLVRVVTEFTTFHHEYTCEGDFDKAVFLEKQYPEDKSENYKVQTIELSETEYNAFKGI